MVTSPYEWKIFEWDEKFQTNKQTKLSICSVLYSGMFCVFITVYNFVCKWPLLAMTIYNEYINFSLNANFKMKAFQGAWGS